MTKRRKPVLLNAKQSAKLTQRAILAEHDRDVFWMALKSAVRMFDLLLVGKAGGWTNQDITEIARLRRLAAEGIRRVGALQAEREGG